MKTVICILLSVLSVRAATWDERVVAAVIMGEARGEGRIGMIAVGEVIRQRCVERKQSPLVVVTARGEFSSKNGKSSAQMVVKYSHLREYATALQVASMVCYRPYLLPGITKSANYFDSKRTTPWWAERAICTAIIGNHKFYRVQN